MPLTDYACPECGGLLHSDDLLEGKCITPGCGAEFRAGLGERTDLPEYDGDDTEPRPDPDATIESIEFEEADDGDN